MTEQKVYEIKLTHDELLLIDGKISKTAQVIIDTAKRERQVGFDIPAMNTILLAAEKRGQLTWRYKSITSCPLCDKKGGYYPHRRSGRYHRKDDPDYKRPIVYSGIAYNEGFITFKNHGDFCTECDTRLGVQKRLIDYILDNDLKIEIQKNEYKKARYRRDDERKCRKCNQLIYESQMGREQTLMGNGTYPSTCPYCKAHSNLFASHEITGQFRMIAVPEREG